MDTQDAEEMAVAEALRRSMVEKTREDALLADVLRASVLSHDEEVARALQAQLNLEDRAPNTPITRQMRTAARIRDSLDHCEREGPWLVARSRGRFQPVKPPTTATGTTATAVAANSVSVHRHPRVPPLPQIPNTPGSGQTLTQSQAAHTSPVTPISAVSTFAVAPRPPSVVLDALNVGCALIGGGGTRFRARGVYLALEYYRARKVSAIALIPRNKVDPELGTVALADDVPLLLRLHEQNRLFFTPPGAHDDNFLLTYAMRHNADLVSNDKFRQEQSRQKGTDAAKRLRVFLRDHRVPFTFVLEEYLPNPSPESLSKHLHSPRDRGYH